MSRCEKVHNKRDEEIIFAWCVLYVSPLALFAKEFLFSFFVNVENPILRNCDHLASVSLFGLLCVFLLVLVPVLCTFPLRVLCFPYIVCVVCVFPWPFSQMSLHTLAQRVKQILPTKINTSSLLLLYFYRVSQKKHSYKFFGLEIMFFTCSQTLWSCRLW